MDVRSRFLNCLYRALSHFFIGGKYRLIAVRNLSTRKPQHGRIHIMLQGIRGYDDVTDINLGIKGTGNTRIDNSINAKHADQDLRAGRGVHFSYAALHNDNVLSIQLPFMERHARDGFDVFFCQRLFERGNFLIHRADDSCFYRMIGVCLRKA